MRPNTILSISHKRLDLLRAVAAQKGYTIGGLLDTWISAEIRSSSVEDDGLFDFFVFPRRRVIDSKRHLAVVLAHDDLGRIHLTAGDARALARGIVNRQATIVVDQHSGDVITMSKIKQQVSLKAGGKSVTLDGIGAPLMARIASRLMEVADQIEKEAT
jgi:hypothetical protein